LAEHAAAAGWKQAAVVGVPPEEAECAIEGVELHPVVFSGSDLPFAVPGMSDVMPYTSSRFSELTEDQLADYRAVFAEHIAAVVHDFRPDVIHSHHVWILSSILKDIAPSIPVVTHCHATGLRQMDLCPHLKDAVVRGVRRNERFVVLHEDHRRTLVHELEIPADRIRVVGAGYRDKVFSVGTPQAEPIRFVYAGKFAEAKGLPALLDAFARIHEVHPDWELHVAGAGGGSAADLIRTRMRNMAPAVTLHGMLSQDALAELFRSCQIFVLPSFYEGLPLVLVEAFASGCSLISTDLSGIREGLAPHLGDRIRLVAPPPMRGPDEPVPEGLEGFVGRLQAAMEGVAADVVDRPTTAVAAKVLEPFTWAAVFSRIERSWRDAIAPLHSAES